MFLTLVVFALTLSILILVHEFGHFLVAKLTGMKVLEFGLGFPPRILGKKIKGTIFSLNWIPFGGFVRIFGQEAIDERIKKGAFWAQSKIKRIAVLLSGVVSNYFLSIFIFSLVFFIVGIPVLTNDIYLGGYLPGSPAQEAGFLQGDQIISFNGQKINSVDEIIEKTKENKGKEVTITIEREDKLLNLPVTPRKDYPQDQGPLGIMLTQMTLKHFPLWQMPGRALVEGSKETWWWTKTIVDGIAKIFSQLIFQHRIPKEAAGPLGVLQITAQVSHQGLIPILNFVAILSINLALLNFLPIPGLDGGWLFFIILETVTRQTSHVRLHNFFNRLGIAFIITLIILVTLNDVNRVLTTTQIGAQIRSLWPF